MPFWELQVGRNAVVYFDKRPKDPATMIFRCFNLDPLDCFWRSLGHWLDTFHSQNTRLEVEVVVFIILVSRVFGIHRGFFKG